MYMSTRNLLNQRICHQTGRLEKSKIISGPSWEKYILDFLFYKRDPSGEGGHSKSKLYIE